MTSIYFLWCIGSRLSAVVIFERSAIIILMVGISRIYLGVHYPTDVLAGLAGGVAWVLLVSTGFEMHAQIKSV